MYRNISVCVVLVFVCLLSPPTFGNHFPCLYRTSVSAPLSHSLRPLFRLPLHSSRSTPGQRTAAFPCFSFGFVVAASVFHLTPLIPFVSFISFVGLLNLDPPRHPPSRRGGIHVASVFAGKVNNDERCKHDEDL